MAVCVEPISFFAFPGPSGSTRYEYTALIPIDPQPGDVSTCSQILITGGEYANSFSLDSPFILNETQAAQIGGAILLLWAVAWGIRLFGRMILSSSNNQEL